MAWLALFLRRRYGFIRTWDNPTVIRLMGILLPLDIGDDSFCACCSRGRPPFLFFLSEYLRNCSTVSSISRKMTELLARQGSRLNLLHPLAVRFATFEALSMVHTCLSYTHFQENARSVKVDNDYDEDDTNSTLSHDGLLLENLELLVAGFEDSTRRDAALTDDEYRQKMVHFWSHEWVNRLDEALDRIREQDILGGGRASAESAGIVNWIEMVPQEDRGEIKGEDTWDYWLWQLYGIGSR